ncbi:MAG: polysaccharide biosynthesis tyrosine autokinase, partial [Gemmataceae bacterium]
LKNPPQPQITDADIEEAIRADPAYMELLKEITVKRRKVDDIRRNAADRVRDSLLKGPVLELRRLEAERKHMIELGRDKLTSRVMNQQKETLQFEIRNIKDRLDQTKKQRDFLEGEVRRWAIEAETFRQGGPKAPPEVEALRDQVKQIEKEYNKVCDELASLEGSLPLPPRISVHAPAFIPTEKDYGRLMKFGLAGSLLAFCGLVAGICLLEARGQRIYTSEDLSQNLGMRVVGTLPYLSSAGRKQLTQNQSLGGLTGPFSLLESIDSIRTILQHSPGMEKARVILVTSATGHEGKTTLASQLAASLARSWRKTLLIDGDLRNPSQQVVFDQQLEPGLCECLRGEVDFEDAIKTTATSRLWLLPAGHVDPHALQALTQEGLTEIFQKFREKFEYIVVDTSPILPVSDGLMLAKRADVVLLSVMRDRSRIPAVFQAQQRLESLSIKVLGCVVIGEKAETYGVSVKYPRTTT